MLHTPYPDKAIPIATRPLTIHETKVTFDNNANRNCRVNSTFCTVHNALTGNNRKKTGANGTSSGMS